MISAVDHDPNRHTQMQKTIYDIKHRLRDDTRKVDRPQSYYPPGPRPCPGERGNIKRGEGNHPQKTPGPPGQNTPKKGQPPPPKRFAHRRAYIETTNSL